MNLGLLECSECRRRRCRPYIFVVVLCVAALGWSQGLLDFSWHIEIMNME